MGVGWGLAGSGSSITRTGKSLPIDGFIDRVKYNNTDAIAFDGQRLIPINGNYDWTGGNDFSVEGDPDTRANYNSGENSWTITYPTGRILKYGTTLESRLEGGGVTINWMLKTVTDLNGNTMTYNYTKDNASLEMEVSNIEYTSNGSHAATNRVEFTYGTRTDISKRVTNKGLYQQSLLLTAVDIKVKNQRLWKYSFNYLQSDLGSPALSEVIKEDGSGTALNSTRFQWEQPKKEDNTKDVYISDATSIVTGDFNGDGITDFMERTTGKICLGTTTFGHFEVISRPDFVGFKGLGDFDNDGYTEVIDNSNRVVNLDRGIIGSLPSTLDSLAVTDYDQNGTPDIVAKGGNVYSYSIQNSNFEVTASANVSFNLFTLGVPADLDGDGYTEYSKTTGQDYIPPTLTTPGFTHSDQYYPDLNKISQSFNDCFKLQNGALADPSKALNDFLPAVHPVIDSIVYWATKESAADAYYWSQNLYNLTAIYGEIMPQFFAQYPNVNAVNIALTEIPRLLNLAYQCVQNHQPGYSTGSFDYSRRCQRYHYDPASKSYNITDSAVFSNKHLVGVYYQYGQLPQLKTAEFTGDNWWSFTPPQFINSDLDGDGKEDYIEHYHFESKIVLTNNPNASPLPLPNEDITNPYIVSVSPGDFNGDGNMDLLYTLSNGNKILRTFTTGNRQMRIVGINNGFNHKTRIRYKTSSDVLATPLTDWCPGTQCQSQENIGSVLNLVSEVQEQKADGSFLSTTYDYSVVLRNPGIQNFIGFEEIRATTPDLGLINRRYYVAYSSWYSPLAANLGCTQGLYFTTPVVLSDKGYRENYTDYNMHILSKNNSYKIITDNSRTGDDYGTGGNGTFVTNRYDTDGQLVNSSSQTMALSDNRYVENTYSGYINGAIPTVVTTRFNMDPATDNTKVNTYDPNTLRLTQTVGNVGITGKEITTSYSNFDDYGHAQTKTVTASGVESITTSVTYDPTGRFITSSTSWQGTETYTYDDITGMPVSKTDVYGNTASSTGNVFGTYASSTSADGIVQTSTTAWANGSGPANALYYTYTTQTGAPWTKTWFDAEGRKLKDETVGYGNASLYTTYSYNSQGKLETCSTFDGQNTKTTTYTYDESTNRLQTETCSDGNITNYSYNSDYAVYITKNGCTTKFPFMQHFDNL
jgi:hypothetical protein